MALQKVRSDLVGTLYGEGWVRLGLRGEPDARILAAEGRGLASRKRLLSALADGVGAEYHGQSTDEARLGRLKPFGR